MARDIHQVQKISVHLNESGYRADDDFTAEMVTFCKNKIVDVIGKKLDHTIPTGTPLWIDRITISCDLVRNDHWEDQLITQITSCLEEELRNAIPKVTSSAQIHKPENDSSTLYQEEFFKAWIGFLNAGELPWWCSDKSWEELLESVNIIRSGLIFH